MWVYWIICIQPDAPGCRQNPGGRQQRKSREHQEPRIAKTIHKEEPSWGRGDASVAEGLALQG